MERPVSRLPSGLTCYLFIYLVRDTEARTGYCTVLAYGRTLESAERIAINRVHQRHLHIVRADTATAAPWLDPIRDGRFLAELEQYGSALELKASADGAAVAA